ncbi:MAG TPA: hypothetical protein PLD20_32175 [Blastocatellia bacterium]|nr:hypothetical protein [Blastocatellia bacterium]HMV87480.1 hypothetical protein [Blastocatellia bacterium]HMX29331.1 hypothetical protein [Blastocatellia bacterium]HMZ22631.1 hypothetical protein [Blastocatellia bacterium]HNG33364.1 hypothetical protein [Blastocatellia bacterium]
MNNQSVQSGQEPPRRTQPKRRDIIVTVIKNPRTGERELKLNPPTVDLTVNEQAAWRCNDGGLEIRFAPNSTPFVTANFRSGTGGTILSGAPDVKKINRIPYKYTLLVTTSDGFFIKQDADLRAVDDQTEPRPPAHQGKGCLTLLGIGLVIGLLGKIRSMIS